MIFLWKPKQTKFKRLHKGRIPKCRFKKTARTTHKGVVGLVILKSARLTTKQLELSRRKISAARKKREKQKMWTQCVTDLCVTAKPLGIRMGKGKGAIDYWSTKAPAGKVIFHLSPRGTNRARKTLMRVLKTFPVPAKIFINRQMRPKIVEFMEKKIC